MKFVSINESDKFRYDDSIAEMVGFVADDLTVKVTALIVRANNSQNSNYTESYADETELVLKKAKVRNIIKEGYKRYDANDNLIEEIPDENIATNVFDIGSLSGYYLINIEEKHGVHGGRFSMEFSMEFEEMNEDPSAITDVFEVIVECEQIEYSWDKYLNKVSM